MVDKEAHLEQEPISFYCTSTERPLLVHFIACGQGNTVLVVGPDGTTWLLDCNVTAEKAEEITAYLQDHIPQREPREGEDGDTQWIDWFVNTHRDEDHLRGLDKINAMFPIRGIMESGITGEGTNSTHYRYFMRLRRTLRDTRGEDAVIIPYIGQTFDIGGGELICLNAPPKNDDDAEEVKTILAEADSRFEKSTTGSISIYEPAVTDNLIAKAVKTQHMSCLVFVVEYAQRRIVLPADSDYKTWRDTVWEEVEMRSGARDFHADVLMASHHGSREFFTDTANKTIDPNENPDTTFVEHVECMRPTFVVVSCGDFEKNHLPNPAALEEYERCTPCDHQVCTTQDWGTLIAVVVPCPSEDQGLFTVVPASFANENPAQLYLTADVVAGDHCFRSYKDRVIEFETQRETEEGQFKVRFRARSKPYGHEFGTDSVELLWYVSNGGKLRSEEHQECRCGNTASGRVNQETVLYRGLHLLRCHLIVYHRGAESIKTEASCVWRVIGRG